MNTIELAEKIAAGHGLTKTQGREVVEAVLSAIVSSAVEGQEIALNGFGRFKVTDRAARQGRNPATGETIDIPASRKLTFTPAKPVRDKLNPEAAGTGAKKAKK